MDLASFDSAGAAASWVPAGESDCSCTTSVFSVLPGSASEFRRVSSRAGLVDEVECDRLRWPSSPVKFLVVWAGADRRLRFSTGSGAEREESPSEVLGLVCPCGLGVGNFGGGSRRCFMP